jgi:hypothetical protein
VARDHIQFLITNSKYPSHAHIYREGFTVLCEIAGGGQRRLRSGRVGTGEAAIEARRRGAGRGGRGGSRRGGVVV